MLRERYSDAFLFANLLPKEAWMPFPPAGDRGAWKALLGQPLNRERRAYLAGQAEMLLGQPWPELPATTYMEFVRNGNRSRYERPYFQRRSNLARLVMAECFEGRGRFLDEIANGIWAITEEASWSVPAHARNAPDPLPNQEGEMVDLFAAETAMVLSEARYLLGPELEALSPALYARIGREVERRVIVPVETREYGWFDGFNNWTPWCASNVLGAAMYVLDDRTRLAALAGRLIEIVDRFIGHYGPDGGCDEGPGYWGVAAGALLLFLEHLYSRSEGAIDVYSEPLIQKMGRFIVDTHLNGPWFTNFADAPARLEMRRHVTYRYGDRIGVQLMKDAALLAARNWDPAGEVYPPLPSGGNGGALNHMLRELFWIPADEVPQGVPNDRTNWFPDLQVLVARESEVLGRGLVLAAKGGHNAESHNHNDIGQFIVMLDGEPGIVDVGVETYQRKTFSPQRYEIWCIRSSGHNVPLVNGVEQVAGRDRAARRVSYASDDGTERLALDLEGAYPEDAAIESLRREFVFASGEGLTVTDTYRLTQGPVEIALPLYTPRPVERLGEGELALGSAEGGRRLILSHDPATLSARVETVLIDDPRLQSAWGDHLQRITLVHRNSRPAGDYRFGLRAEG